MRAIAPLVLAASLLLGACQPADGDGPLAMPPPDPGARRVVPVREPEPLPVAAWLTTVLNPQAGDPVMAALEAGTFKLPEEGTQGGLRWLAIEPGDNGELRSVAAGWLMYAAAEVEIPAGRGLLSRADTVITMHVGGAVLPGDLYGSGRIRVPLPTQPGRNLVVVRGLGGRSRPAVQLYTTPDEVYLNPRDVTAPDLVVGEAAEQHLGVPVLVLTAAPLREVEAQVEESAHLHATTIRYPSLAAGAVTQVAFHLRPKVPWSAAGQKIPVGLRLDAPALRQIYRAEITLETVARGAAHRRTFRSSLDGSAQYYGVVPPSAPAAERGHGLVLTLHGAGVEGIGQARAYSPKDWAYIVAPTNRRPFGFDWEEWGRLDAIEVLDQAMATFRIAPDQVYVTGHSMGGHGTWQLGALFPGRFATVGPSAGWASFYSYVGQPRPTGPFARSQASSDTVAYLGNLARRGVYILHGDRDDNVPVREGRDLAAAVRTHTGDVVYHEQPGAGHWWDGDQSPGVDCVDWPPLFDFMKARRLDPLELDFRFVTPSPRVSARHSFVTLLSQGDAYRDSVVSSSRRDDTVTLSTTNVRSLRLDGAALRSRGIARVVVDGAALEVADGPMPVGPQTGKRPGAHGPLNDVFTRPFCFVYPDDGPAAYRRYASFLVSNWAVIGNGHACALPMSAVTAAIRADYNLIYLGVRPPGLGALGWPIAISDGTITIDGRRHDGSALALVFPEGDRLSALLLAAAGAEHLLFRLRIFHSGFAVPDYMVWSSEVRAAGFFTADWKYQP
jgi:poly(3-hydroxybutyrate) depolymerase